MYTSARNTVMWRWSVDTFFDSFDQNMDVQYEF